MDGFKVETTTLAKAGSRYISAGAALSDCAEQLHRLKHLLNGQSVGVNLCDKLRGAIHSVEFAADETRELGLQCAKVAETYDRTERQVMSVLAALNADPPFAAGESGGGVRVPTEKRIISAYRPAKPIPFNGNTLPAEGWLIDRAINTL